MNQLLTPQEPIHFTHWYNNEMLNHDRFPELYPPAPVETLPYYLDPLADKLMLENLTFDQINQRQQLLNLQQLLSIAVEDTSPIDNLTSKQAQVLLEIKDILIDSYRAPTSKHIDKIYHRLRRLVDPNLSRVEPWKELEQLILGGKL